MTPSEIKHRFRTAAASMPGELLAQLALALDRHPDDLELVADALRALEAEHKGTKLHYTVAPPRK